MQTSQVYAVDRVYGDLQPQFVAKDVLKALAQLDAVVGDVFNRLALKVSQEKDRVAAVDKRILVCQAKVNALTARRSSNKPTTVFSTSKYPAPDKLALPKTLFHDKPYADAPPLVPDADDDTHFLPAEPLPPAQRGQHMAEVLELLEKVNEFQKTQQPEAGQTARVHPVGGQRAALQLRGESVPEGGEERVFLWSCVGADGLLLRSIRRGITCWARTTRRRRRSARSWPKHRGRSSTETNWCVVEWVVGLWCLWQRAHDVIAL